MRQNLRLCLAIPAGILCVAGAWIFRGIRVSAEWCEDKNLQAVKRLVTWTDRNG